MYWLFVEAPGSLLASQTHSLWRAEHYMATVYEPLVDKVLSVLQNCVALITLQDFMVTCSNV